MTRSKLQFPKTVGKLRGSVRAHLGKQKRRRRISFPARTGSLLNLGFLHTNYCCIK